MAFREVGRRSGFVAVFALVLSLPPAVASADDAVVRIGGTGMSLALMRAVGDGFATANPGLRVEVLPSLGTQGGLRALDEGIIDIAISARALKPEEKAKGLSETACMTTPMGFVSSHANPAGVGRADLPALFAEPSPIWPDGQPLKIILRSRASWESPFLIAAIPGMGAALEKAYAQSGVPVATTDQDNADLAQRIPGSFAFMSLLQLKAERLHLRMAALDGVAASPTTLADGSYPLTARICAVLAPESKPAAAKFLAHLQSDDGEAVVRALGAAPSGQARP